MPFAIDDAAINDSNLKVMDILKPPTKSIPFQEFPKMLYLHPKDKTKEHRTRVVQNVTEQEAALAQGWRIQPHIQQEAQAPLSDDFQVDMPEQAEVRRGPGRPKLSQESVA